MIQNRLCRVAALSALLCGSLALAQDRGPRDGPPRDRPKGDARLSERPERKDAPHKDEQRPGHRARVLELVFEKFDANHDGVIDKSEFAKGMPRLMQRLHERRRERMGRNDGPAARGEGFGFFGPREQRRGDGRPDGAFAAPRRGGPRMGSGGEGRFEAERVHQSPWWGPRDGGVDRTDRVGPRARGRSEDGQPRMGPPAGRPRGDRMGPPPPRGGGDRMGPPRADERGRDEIGPRPRRDRDRDQGDRPPPPRRDRGDGDDMEDD